jgi:hypothetical protein
MRYRTILSCLGLPLLLAVAVANQTSPQSEPLMYELVINGESFTVEANRVNKLTSKARPGTTYDVALRVAQVQRLVLNRVQLDYDRGFQISDDRGERIRTATLKHELGFSLAVTELGNVLDAAGRQQVLDTLKASLEQSFREAKATDLVVGKVQERKFASVDAKGLTIQYQDASGLARSCLLYVLDGKRFTASCIVQFLDDDHEAVLPLVKQTLDTLQARGGAARKE